MQGSANLQRTQLVQLTCVPDLEAPLAHIPNSPACALEGLGPGKWESGALPGQDKLTHREPYREKSRPYVSVSPTEPLGDPSPKTLQSDGKCPRDGSPFPPQKSDTPWDRSCFVWWKLLCHISSWTGTLVLSNTAF